jgi:hypothetical protein
MINLFIDTTIFLNFYSFSDEDLKTLSGLHRLINKTEKIKLYIPSQLVDEFNRNREKKIYETMKQFKELNIKTQIPKICSGYKETKIINSISQDLYREKNELIKIIDTAIGDKSLKADLIIKDLFLLSTQVSEEIIDKARKRFDLGNPPGKNHSYGDAINWEFLLSNIPSGEDLYFVGTDKDYVSPLNENNFSLFLKEEWERDKLSKIFYYRSLNNFFKDKFPELQLKDYNTVDIEIEEFAASPTFDIARSRLKRLHKINEFSDEQINNIVKASISNDQIYNAHTYSPFVGEMLRKIINGHENQINPDDLREFNELFKIELRDEANIPPEVPF